MDQLTHVLIKFLQISVPMSVEFDEIAKARENPTEELASKLFNAFNNVHLHMFSFLDMVEFSDEEGYGKYLDLHECYERYINLKGIEVILATLKYIFFINCGSFLQKVDYITYLSTFDQLFDIPKERKSGEYRRYLISLVDYLRDFVNRIKPLMDADSELHNAIDIMESQWEAGTFPGWPVSFNMCMT